MKPLVGVMPLWDDDKERLIHNVSLLRKDIDEVNVVVHQDTEKHVVVIAAKFSEALNIRANINALGTN